MTQVSKYPIPKNIADRIFDIFIKTLIRISGRQEARNLANDLFSPTERVMLAKRLAIAFLLMKEYQYREISKILLVSLATIASVNSSEKSLSLPAKVSAGGGSWRYLLRETRKAKAKKDVQF